MRLESIPKYFSPKSPKLSDESPATRTDALSITDVMAAIGMTHQSCGIGLDLFLAKVGVSDPDKAVEGLVGIARSLAGQCKPIYELDEDTKLNVLQVLATFAYQDYSRSAASVRPCPDCADGFIDSEVFTVKPAVMKAASKMKPAGPAKKREIARVLCPTCKGKRVVSNSCRCHGKGVVVDIDKTTINGGVPVFKECNRCSGRGYSRLKFSSVVSGVNSVCVMSKTTAYDHIKPFFEMLVSECHKQEEFASSVLQKVTK